MLDIVPKFEFEAVKSCPLCNGGRAEAHARRTVQGLPLEYSRCLNCAAIYLNPRMTRDSLARYFSSEIFINDPNAGNLDELLGYPDYFDWDTSYAKTAGLRLNRIAKFKPPPGRLLEIGTATGSFLNAARSQGYEVRGLDLSSAFAAIAKRTYALDIDVDYIEEANLPDAAYDAVCNFGGVACWRDPVRALSNIHKALKPDGVLVLNYFNLDSLPGRILGDRHFEFNHASLLIYSNTTMRRCLDRAGFEVVYCQNERQFATLGRIAGYLKQGWLLNAIRRCGLDQFTVPMVVPGTMFAVCRKTDR